MKIIHTISGIAESAGGPSRVVASLCSAVADLGGDVELVAGHDARLDGSLVRPSSPGVGVHLIAAKRLGRIPLHPGFLRVVKQLAHPQGNAGALIHDHGIWGLTNIAASRAAHWAGVPYVLHTHGMLEPWALSFKARKKQLAWVAYQKRIIDNSAVLVATSDQERDGITRLFPRHPVAVIPNGVWLPQTVPNRAFRSPIGRANLLFMSRVHPVKNLLGLVRAWGAVCRTPSRERWMLQIAGPDELDHSRAVKELVRSLQLESRVEFLGPIAESNKNSLLEGADIFILPSFSENFGIVVAEAMAYGLPVIATTSTPWSSLVQRKCGWWADTSPEALTQALAQAIDMSNIERHQMGMKGREFCQQAFSWEKIGASTLQLYDWVTKRTHSTPPFLYV